jgi:hypothetical protein
MPVHSAAEGLGFGFFEIIGFSKQTGFADPARCATIDRLILLTTVR